MTAVEIIQKYLIENNFDGLTSGDCSCAISDLMPCGEGKSCEPAYKVKCKKQCGDFDYCLNTSKEYICEVGK